MPLVYEVGRLGGPRLALCPVRSWFGQGSSLHYGKCHVLRRPLMVDTQAWLRKSESRAPQRTYSTSSHVASTEDGIVNGKREQLPGRGKARGQFVISTKNPQNITKEDVLKQLSSVFRPDVVPVDGAQRPGLALLVTPSFASWLDDSVFIGKILSVVFQYKVPVKLQSPIESENYQSWVPLRASTLLAVVDGLPPAPTISGKDFEASVEGFAFMVGDHKRFLPDLFTIEDEPARSDNVALTFSFDSRADAPPTLDNDVIVPLSNTLFRNGRKATLLAGGWQRNSASDFFEPVLSMSKESQQIIPSHNMQAARVHVTAPLVPLTPGRRVINSLGNIVRKITDKDNNSQPASQELEKGIAAYLKSKNIKERAVSVWALVVPAKILGDKQHESLSKSATIGASATNILLHHENIQKDWEGDITEQRFLTELLKKGAQLHRVVSGGGGWGPKAGLLSLDPQTSFHMAESARYDFTSMMGESFGETAAEALPSVAEPGAVIQFWIAHDTIRSPPLDLEHKSPLTNNKHTLDSETLVLGCIPSTIDDIPLDTSTKSPDNSNSTAEADLTVHEGHFGAQSESGIFISTNIPKIIRTKHKDYESSISKSNSNRKVGLNTKLNVPYSYYSLRFWEGPGPSKKGHLRVRTFRTWRPDVCSKRDGSVEGELREP